MKRERLHLEGARRCATDSNIRIFMYSNIVHFYGKYERVFSEQSVCVRSVVAVADCTQCGELNKHFIRQANSKCIIELDLYRYLTLMLWSWAD